MNIGSIKSLWLRRLALCLYVPLFMIVMTILGICGAVAEAAYGARDGWCDVTDNSWDCIVRCWRK